MSVTTATGVDADIDVSLGSFELALSLHLAAGTTVAVLGPNGAGKTTLLRCLAGLLAVDRGRIVVDGLTVDESARNVFIPAERRPVGVVFQDYLLFAHLSALDNVAFGLRARGTAKSEARAQAATWLASVGLGDRAGHRPGQLSGGQAQRVALARALATHPRLLLLDEPLGALDAGTRAATRRDLRRHLATFDGVGLLITHDPLDALTLADHVVILEDGRVTQHGPLADVVDRPRSGYVADLLGTNLWRGTAHGSTIDLDAGGHLTIATPHVGPVFVTARPSAIALATHEPSGSPRNNWPGTITSIDLHGERARVHLGATPPVTAEITTAALTALGLRPGDRAWASLKATEIAAYER